MTTTTVTPVAAQSTVTAPAVDIVVPVHNEAHVLSASIERLHDYLTHSFPFSWRVTIADNASTDGTRLAAEQLAHRLPHVRATHLEVKGRGHALRAAWENNDAVVVAYMDVDLSTDLAALLPLVAPLLSGHSDLAIGSRLSRGARTVRGPKREVISRCYNALLRLTLGAHFTDAQCGFKAIRADRAAALLPAVRDDGWFFDTELLVLAERSGLRIHEVPVDWTDDPDSRVDIVATAIGDLRGVVRLARDSVRQAVRFLAIGVVSTLAYVLCYLGLRLAVPPQAANAVALFVTAVGNTAANRRLTFGVRGRRRALRHHVESLAVFGLCLALTAGGLLVMHATDGRPGRAVEVGVLILANLAATIVRFLALRSWVFNPRRHAR